MPYVTGAVSGWMAAGGFQGSSLLSSLPRYLRWRWVSITMSGTSHLRLDEIEDALDARFLDLPRFALEQLGQPLDVGTDLRAQGVFARGVRLDQKPDASRTRSERVSPRLRLRRMHRGDRVPPR